MSPTALVIVLLALAAAAFHLGRRRAFAVSASVGGTRNLHSLPTYYGGLTALWCGLPAVIVLGLWSAFEPTIVENLVVSSLPEETRALPPQRLNFVINDIRNLAEGNIVSGEIVPEMRAAADRYIDLRRTGAAASAVVVLAVAMAGLGLATPSPRRFATGRTDSAPRARRRFARWSCPRRCPASWGGLLAISRAIGETMIVVMAAGLAANLTANPLQAVTTVTVQIVTLLVGDQEFDSPKTLAAFALGLVLFTMTLCLNVIALQVVRKYREQYE